MYFFFVNKLAPKVYLIKKIVRNINKRELSLAEGLSKEKALNIFEVLKQYQSVLIKYFHLTRQIIRI